MTERRAPGEAPRLADALALAGHHQRGGSTALTISEALRQAQSAGAAHAFVRLHAEAAQATAERLDALAPAQRHALPLLGVPLSVKDLFDSAGDVTTAGSRVLADAPPAAHDAPALARLKAAGAVVVGRSNMTEFAFSGLGLNPHYGTPLNPADRQVARIPGGSSSGAAVSVATGAAAIGLGSDTGGSIRIPAALCGLVGFKPTQRTVPLEGTVPLSTTLDTACAITRSARDAAAVHAVLSAQAVKASAPSLAAVHLVVPGPTLLDELDPTVQAAFDRALTRLSAAGCRISHQTMRPIAELPQLQAHGTFSNAEAYAWHEPRLAQQHTLYDPRVLARILRGRDMSAAQYVRLVWARRAWISAMNAAFGDATALMCPTVPVVAPPLASITDDSEYTRLNLLMLRNPSIINFWDGCAISLPCHRADLGELPVGVMLAAPGGHDDALLGLAQAVEQALRDTAS